MSTNIDAHGFASFPQLNAHLKSMFDDYFHGREPSNTEKAALIFGCGVAAEQVYSASMSGTFGIDQAHEGLQRFGCGTADLRYPHHTDLFSRMKGNVMNACPVLFACLVATGPGGHNMVVDGYNSDDYYHVNFGWGGGYNGWYLLPSELPYNLTIIEGAIVDIATNECDPMDCNCDRRVDSDDLRYMLPCLTGPMGPSYAPGCDSFDTDADLDTDLADFSLFQTTYATTT